MVEAASIPDTPLCDALSVEPIGLDRDGAILSGRIHDGWDAYGIPLGGYVMAQAAQAALVATDAPDVFTITTHFLAKGSLGPVTYRVKPLGGGRRFTSHLVEARQSDRLITASLVSVGDRDTIDGPEWQQRSSPDLDGRLGPPAGTPGEPFPTPAAAQQLGIRLDRDSVHFSHGQQVNEAVIRAVVDPVVATPTDQLLALVACDVTPPAVWNALGAHGWVPTVELTAQVRGRPQPGPLRVVASTRSVSGGLFEEDAEVFDADGRLVVLSRQLARWSESPRDPAS